MMKEDEAIKMRELRRYSVLQWARHCNVPADLIPDSFVWDPSTLKQISTHVIALGKSTSSMPSVMSVLAKTEIELSRLRERIGIERTRPVGELPRVAVLLAVTLPTGEMARQATATDKSKNLSGRSSAAERKLPAAELMWASPGHWVPDVLDRAAAFDPLHTIKSPSRDQSGWCMLTTRELETFNLDHVIVLEIVLEIVPDLPAPTHPGPEVELPEGFDLLTQLRHASSFEAHYSGSLIELGRLSNTRREALLGIAKAIHFSSTPSNWLSSGPGVFNAVFEAAEFIHGIKK